MMSTLQFPLQDPLQQTIKETLKLQTIKETLQLPSNVNRIIIDYAKSTFSSKGISHMASKKRFYFEEVFPRFYPLTSHGLLVLTQSRVHEANQTLATQFLLKFSERAGKDESLLLQENTAIKYPKINQNCKKEVLFHIAIEILLNHKPIKELQGCYDIYFNALTILQEKFKPVIAETTTTNPCCLVEIQNGKISKVASFFMKFLETLSSLDLALLHSYSPKAKWIEFDKIIQSENEDFISFTAMRIRLSKQFDQEPNLCKREKYIRQADLDLIKAGKDFLEKAEAQKKSEIQKVQQQAAALNNLAELF